MSKNLMLIFPIQRQIILITNTMSHIHFFHNRKYYGDGSIKSIATNAYKVDAKNGQVICSGSVYRRKKTDPQNWNRRMHVATARARMEDKSVSIKFSLPLLSDKMNFYQYRALEDYIQRVFYNIGATSCKTHLATAQEEENLSLTLKYLERYTGEPRTTHHTIDEETSFARYFEFLIRLFFVIVFYRTVYALILQSKLRF